jgi:hypothetical protein
MGIVAMLPAAVSAAPQTCKLITNPGSESIVGGAGGPGSLAFLATWEATTADCTNPALNGRMVELRQTALIERVGPARVRGTTSLQLSLNEGANFQMKGRVLGTIACTTARCTLDLNTRAEGRRALLNSSATLIVSRWTGTILSFGVEELTLTFEN